MQYSDDEDELEALDRRIELAQSDRNRYATGTLLLEKADLLKARSEAADAARAYLSAWVQFDLARLPELISETLLRASQLKVSEVPGFSRVELALCRYEYCVQYVHDNMAVVAERHNLLDCVRSCVGVDSLEMEYIRAWIFSGQLGYISMAWTCQSVAGRARSGEYVVGWADKESFLSFAYLTFTLANQDEPAREIKRLLERPDVNIWIGENQRLDIDLTDRLRTARRNRDTATLSRVFDTGEVFPLGRSAYLAFLAALLRPRAYDSEKGRSEFVQRIRHAIGTRQLGRPPARRTFSMRWRAGVVIALWRLNCFRYALGLPLADVDLNLGLEQSVGSCNTDHAHLEALRDAAWVSITLLYKRARRMDLRHETSNYSASVDRVRASLTEAELRLAPGESSRQ